jgi:hypothetical protein
MPGGIVTEVTTSVTPTLNISTGFTNTFLGGSGQMAATGDNASRVLVYIFLQFNSSIL